MKVRWPGLILIALLVADILLVKSRTRRKDAPAAFTDAPAIVLVADLREADEKNDRCAEIIRAVRETSKRGVKVAELRPDSNSDLIQRYRVLTVPTVLLLDKSGKEIARFEGEDATTVKAVEQRLAAANGNTR